MTLKVLLVLNLGLRSLWCLGGQKDKKIHRKTAVRIRLRNDVEYHSAVNHNGIIYLDIAQEIILRKKRSKPGLSDTDKINKERSISRAAEACAGLEGWRSRTIKRAEFEQGQVCVSSRIER